MILAIRQAAEPDVPELLAIEREAFPGTQHWQARDFMQHECLLAEVDGRVAGFVVSRETYPAQVETAAEREILNVAVAPFFRRMGIATKLLRWLLNRPAVYFLEVRESNRGAQALYRKLGFAEVGRRSEYYSDPAETAIVMQVK